MLESCVESGERLANDFDPGRSKWPDGEGMTSATIAKAIEEAYNNTKKMGPIQYSWQDGLYQARQFFEGKCEIE